MKRTGLTRVFGVSRSTVATVLRKEAETLSPWRRRFRWLSGTFVLELDELWSFLGCKRRVRWLWVALCLRLFIHDYNLARYPAA